MCFDLAKAQSNGAIFTVKDWGRGMEFGLPLYRNDPEAPVLIHGMYSRAPGQSQMRFGAFPVLHRDTADAVMTGGGIDALVEMSRRGDSIALVMASGGRYYWSFWGAWSADEKNSVTTVQRPREIKPYIGSDMRLTNAGSDEDVTITLGRCARDLQPGDTIIAYDPQDTCVVRYVMADVPLQVDTLNGFAAHTNDTFATVRHPAKRVVRRGLHINGSDTTHGNSHERYPSLCELWSHIPICWRVPSPISPMRPQHNPHIPPCCGC